MKLLTFIKMNPNKTIVEYYGGGNVVGTCTERDSKGDPIQVVDFSGKIYNINSDGKFE